MKFCTCASVGQILSFSQEQEKVDQHCCQHSKYCSKPWNLYPSLKEKKSFKWCRIWHYASKVLVAVFCIVCTETDFWNSLLIIWIGFNQLQSAFCFYLITVDNSMWIIKSHQLILWWVISAIYLSFIETHLAAAQHQLNSYRQRGHAFLWAAPKIK